MAENLEKDVLNIEARYINPGKQQAQKKPRVDLSLGRADWVVGCSAAASRRDMMPSTSSTAVPSPSVRAGRAGRSRAGHSRAGHSRQSLRGSTRSLKRGSSHRGGFSRRGWGRGGWGSLKKTKTCSFCSPCLSVIPIRCTASLYIVFPITDA